MGPLTSKEKQQQRTNKKWNGASFLAWSQNISYNVFACATPENFPKEDEEWRWMKRTRSECLLILRLYFHHYYY